MIMYFKIFSINFDEFLNIYVHFSIEDLLF